MRYPPQFLYVSESVSLTCARTMLETIAAFVSPTLQTSMNKQEIVYAINDFLGKIEYIIDPSHPYTFANIRPRADMLVAFVQLYLQFISNTCVPDSKAVIGFRKRWSEFLCNKNMLTRQRRFVHIYKVLADIAIIISKECSIYFYLHDTQNKGATPDFLDLGQVIAYLHDSKLQFSKSRVKTCLEGLGNSTPSDLHIITRYLGLALRLRQIFDTELCPGYLTTDTEDQHHVFEHHLTGLIKAVETRLQTQPFN